MSALALRRVMIRLVHDPCLVEAVYRDPDTALRGVDLSETERGWLLCTPRAAWSTDPGRPQRVLEGLQEEFAVSVQMLPRSPLEFFSTAAFHDAVQGRGSLAAGFGAWLASAAPPASVAIVQIETAIAQTRRAPRVAPPSATGCRRLSPAASLLLTPAGTLARYERARRGDLPTAAPPPGVAPEHLLVVRPPGSADVTIEELPTALGELLLVARTSRPRAALVTAARALGADAGDDEAIVAGLEADRLLV
mgnify:CR=1 FL=1